MAQAAIERKSIGITHGELLGAAIAENKGIRINVSDSVPVKIAEENPLEKFSTADLLAEIERRNIK